MKLRHVLPLLAAMALGACAGQPPATTATLMTASAVVESVDQSTRQVRLRDTTTDHVFTVVAGQDVQNLPQVSAGDLVEVSFYESTTLAMADPADTGQEVTTVAVGTAPRGTLPGGIAAATTSMVVQVLDYDRNSGLATFITPDGRTQRTTVPPALRSFAEARQPGARVAVTMTDAVAVTMRTPGS